MDFSDPIRYRSEVRDSTVSSLLDKVKSKNYLKYLLSVRLNKIRRFNGAEVKFEFPVTALIAPNGGGKSTILGAAACAYRQTRPGQFFPKSSIGDDSMADWNISYEIIDKAENASGTLARTSRFRQRKWVRDPIADRKVLFFGIDRTVPASERQKYKKLTAPDYRTLTPLSVIDPKVATYCARILGTSVSEFERADIGGGLKFYIGGDRTTRYSEFHFGAGESSVIRIVEEIEAALDSSLILIEEIENGLHPVAVRRLVEYLVDAAERKRLQILFTTHSDAALQPLPPQAIWASINGALQQGRLSIEALRAVSGRIDRDLAIFVEDAFAANWLRAMIRSEEQSLLERVGIY